MTNVNKNLQSLFADRQYQQHCAELSELSREKYEMTKRLMFGSTWCNTDIANDPADQSRVDDIISREKILTDLNAELYARHGANPSNYDSE